jgi:hypothetical protein
MFGINVDHGMRPILIKFVSGLVDGPFDFLSELVVSIERLLLNIQPAALKFLAYLVGYPKGLFLSLENRRELRAHAGGVAYQVQKNVRVRNEDCTIPEYLEVLGGLRVPAWECLFHRSQMELRLFEEMR